MSEADVIRRGLVNPVWTGLSYTPTDATREEALASLDSLTTRLAEVTNRMHVLQAQLDDSATRLAEVERENDLVRHENHEARSQLTQAREALERVRGEVRQHYAACDHDDRPASLALRNVANEALATINEGETE